MNPFKPLIQFFEEFYGKAFEIKMSLSKMSLKTSLEKFAT